MIDSQDLMLSSVLPHINQTETSIGPLSGNGCQYIKSEKNISCCRGCTVFHSKIEVTVQVGKQPLTVVPEVGPEFSNSLTRQQCETGAVTAPC